MRLSTKGRHAITAMLELAVSNGNRAVTIAEIAKNQAISISYLEQLFACLRKKNLVKGVRGPGGGYYLGRAADNISIADVICAVDEWVELSHVSIREGYQKEKKSPTQNLWDSLSKEIFDFLDNITLHKLVARHDPSVNGFKQHQRVDRAKKLDISDTKAA